MNSTAIERGESELECKGYALLKGIFKVAEVEELRTHLGGMHLQNSGAGRRLFGEDWALIREKALHGSLVDRIAQAFASIARLPDKIALRCLRATLFDKTVEANWKVPWHQDLTIPIEAKHDVPGFGPWTRKDGIDHVQPPVSILENILAARIHLDPCGLDNGCLRVLAGSHRNGRLSSADIQEWRSRSEAMVECDAELGDVLLMYPLLLHASSPAGNPARRRVLHLEFAACKLPEPLQWKTM